MGPAAGTGTSFHDGEARNILTIAYYGVEDSTEGWTDWVQDYDHDGGNDTATELTAMLYVEQDQTTGYSPVVSGTVREDGEFDLFAQRLQVGTGDVGWAETYADPEGTDDECTGLTGGPLGSEAVVVVCGQVGTDLADDTVYLAWALDFSLGTPIWNDENQLRARVER